MPDDILTVAREVLAQYEHCKSNGISLHVSILKSMIGELSVTDVSRLAQAVIDLSAALARYRWRPISELHEDYGDCVLMNIADAGYLVVGSNLNLDFDESKWTHFTRITPLGQEEYERLEEEARAAPEGKP